MEQAEKRSHGRRDWNDVVNATIDKNKVSRGASWFQGSNQGEDETEARVWNEVTFVQREMNSLEEKNRTYEEMAQDFNERFRILRRDLSEIFEMRFPAHRMLIEQRLSFLESEFLRFSSQITPHHVQPGLLLDLSLTNIKRKKITSQGMTNVLTEFLSGISRGFSDRSMSQHERYRSTVTEGLGSFSEPTSE